MVFIDFTSSTSSSSKKRRPCVIRHTSDNKAYKAVDLKRKAKKWKIPGRSNMTTKRQLCAALEAIGALNTGGSSSEVINKKRKRDTHEPTVKRHKKPKHKPFTITTVISKRERHPPTSLQIPVLKRKAFPPYLKSKKELFKRLAREVINVSSDTVVSSTVGSFRKANETDERCFEKSIGYLPLKPHQLQVVHRLMQLDVRGVLAAYTVGSGKTLASIATAEALIRCYQGEVRITGAVVVVPASLVANYEKELIKFHVKDPTRYKIMSTEKFVNDPPTLTNKILIIDEAHNLRNGLGKMSSAVQASARTAAKVLLMTGTPISNYPYEIATLLNMIMNLDEKPLPLKSTHWAKEVGASGIDLNSGFVANRIRDIVAKHVLYYSPTDRSDYPSMVMETTQVAMNEEQTESHLDVAKGIRLTVRNLEKTVVAGGGLPSFFVVPRQISNGVDSHPGPKFDIILKRVQSAIEKGRKSLIYSFFLGKGIHFMTELLREKGIAYAVFSGQESAEEKKKAVEQYNSGKLKVLLISGSGAEGLDLKFTSYVHLVEVSWNTAMTQQVIGRACRYRSHEADDVATKRITASIPKSVHVYKYVAILPNQEGGSTMANYKGYKALLHFSADQILDTMADAKDRNCTRFIQALIRTTTSK